jgi:hypothetical protein
MIDLLLDCSIFYHVEGTLGNYYQICGQCSARMRRLGLRVSGIPISELKPSSGGLPTPGVPTREAPLSNEDKKPSAIIFVRSRMFYARAVLNAKGNVRFGMRHIRKAHMTSDL